VFEWAEYSEDISPESLARLVSAVSAHASGDGDRLTILLLADQRGLDLEAIVAALGAEQRVIGAVFPALLDASGVRNRGAYAVLADVPSERAILRDAFEPAAVVEAQASVLLQEHPEAATLFVLLDGQTPGSADTVLQGLRHPFVEKGASFIGGGAGYGSLSAGPCLFTESEVLPRGAAIVVRFGARSFIGVEHGWSKLAGPFYASRTDNTTVLELNWRRASEVYEEHVGPLVDGPITAESFPSVGARFPLAVLKMKEGLIVRDPMVLTPDGGLFTLGTVPEHSLVVVLEAAPDALLAAATAAARNAKRGAEEHGGRAPRSELAGGAIHAFVFDCVSRIDALGTHFGNEVDAIQREFSAPIVGVLSLGEVASSAGNVVEFYNKTTVVVCR
jgi:hypothetical protein